MGNLNPSWVSSDRVSSAASAVVGCATVGHLGEVGVFRVSCAFLEKQCVDC